jgi:hypothetical protein
MLQRPPPSVVRARKAEIKRRYRRKRKDGSSGPIGMRIAELAELRRLREARGQSAADIDAILESDDVVTLTGQALGRLLAFTFDDYKDLRTRRNRHVSTIRPHDATGAEIKSFLKAFHRPRKALSLRRKRAAAAAERDARRRHAADLDCRKSALDALIDDRWQTVAQLARRTATLQTFRTPLGEPLAGASLRRTIRRLLATPELTEKITIDRRPEKHGGTMILVRRR